MLFIIAHIIVVGNHIAGMVGQSGYTWKKWAVRYVYRELCTHSKFRLCVFIVADLLARIIDK